MSPTRLRLQTWGRRCRSTPRAATYARAPLRPTVAAAVCAIATLVGAGLRAQEPHGPTLDDLARASNLVRFWVEDGRIPGAVLSVWQHGVPMLEVSYGNARSHGYGSGQYGARVRARDVLDDLAEPDRMSVETVFDLASVTKVMATTNAVALLVERGMIELDAPVSRYLPDFVGGGKEEITIEHLLTHRSGLSQWQPVYYHATDASGAYRFIRDLPLEWPVGAERHYSDLGFMLLGIVVERVTGSTLDRFVSAELYRPLGLEATGFRGSAGAPGVDYAYASTSHGNPFEHRMVHDLDFGYPVEVDADAWNGWRRYTLSGEVNDGNAHHAFGGVAGHAGLFSTAGDLQVLLRLWLGGGVVGGRRFVGAEVVDRFLAPTGNRQALGWQLPEYAPAGSFGHTGFTGTFVLGVPELGLGVVLLTNRQNGGVDDETAYPDVGELQRSLARALSGAR